MAPKRSKTGFNFTKLPIFALDEIIGGMGIYEIFALSVCSKKCSAAIRRAHIPTMSYKMDIKIKDDEKRIKVWNPNDENDYGYWYFSSRKRPNSKSKNNWNTSVGYFVAKPSYNSFKCFCPARQQDVGMNQLISHLLQIFPRALKIQKVDINFQNLADKFQVRKAISSIVTCETLHLGWNNYSRDTEYMMKNLEVTKTFSNESSVYTGGKTIGKLKCTNQIFIDNATWMLGEALLALNCSLICLLSTQFTSDDIMEFLKKWKASEGDEMRNIHYVHIGLPFGVVLSLEEELDAKPWDPIKRNRYYVHPKWTERTDRDMELALDIQRSDGLLASIQYVPDVSIEFFVWHHPF